MGVKLGTTTERNAGDKMNETISELSLRPITYVLTVYDKGRPIYFIDSKDLVELSKEVERIQKEEPQHLYRIESYP